MIGKRGAAMTELASIGIVFFAGAIYLLTAYFLAGDGAVAGVAGEDFGDQRAHYLLHGLLRTEMTSPPAELGEVFVEPTIGDLFAYYGGFGSLTSEEAELHTSVSKGIIHLLEEEGRYFAVYLDGALVTSNSPTFKGDHMQECDDSFIEGSSSATLNGRQGNLEVVLEYCEVRS